MEKQLTQLLGRASCLVLLCVGFSHASVSVFTDKTSFDTAATTIFVEGFEAVTPKNSTQSSFTSNGNTYTALPGFNVFVASSGFTNFGIPITTTSILTASGDEDFTVDFGTPSEAVGFDTYLNQFGPATVEVHGPSGLLDTITHNHASNTIGFLGLVASEPIHSIRWTTVNGAAINTGIDNIFQGTVIPEPTTLTVLAIGSVALLRRRIAS